MRRAVQASLESTGCVEVVRDDGRLTMVYWQGSLQGCVYRRGRRR
jgi:hypothetical protein